MRINKKTILLIGVIVMMAAVFLSGCGKQTGASFGAPERLSDYLYYIEYSDYIPEVAGDLQPIQTEGGCSTVRNGNFFGRNLDMNYCECVEFVVHMKHSEKRFASIGLSANPYIGTNCSEMTEDELLRIPTITNDGINENGVLASVHVVRADGIDDMSGTNGGGKVIDGRYVVRYVLDHAESAAHAVSLLEQANIVGGFGDYGLHWLIADKNDTFIVEVIDGRLEVSKNEFSFMTNFYLNYGPVQEKQTIGGMDFENMPLLNERAIGVERWDYIRTHYEEGASFEGMAKLMEDVKATTVYSQSVDELWLTEHSGDGLTIHSSREDFLSVATAQQEMYEHRDRTDPQGDWISWHTSVYDIAQRKLTVWSQEDYSAPYEFTLKRRRNGGTARVLDLSGWNTQKNSHFHSSIV